MDQAIDIVVYLTIRPGQETAAAQTAQAITAHAATIDGLQMSDAWEGGDGIGPLVLRFHATGQAAVDQHLAEHGPLYAAFTAVGAVDRVTTSGPADAATIAAMQRLSGRFERI